MIKVFNHKANSLHEGLLLDFEQFQDIETFVNENVYKLSLCKILEESQKMYGIGGMVLAAFLLGETFGLSQTNDILNKIFYQWQREN